MIGSSQLLFSSSSSTCAMFVLSFLVLSIVGIAWGQVIYIGSGGNYSYGYLGYIGPVPVKRETWSDQTFFIPNPNTDKVLVYLVNKMTDRATEAYENLKNNTSYIAFNPIYMNLDVYNPVNWYTTSASFLVDTGAFMSFISFSVFFKLQLEVSKYTCTGELVDGTVVVGYRTVVHFDVPDDVRVAKLPLLEIVCVSPYVNRNIISLSMLAHMGIALNASTAGIIRTMSPDFYNSSSQPLNIDRPAFVVK